MCYQDALGVRHGLRMTCELGSTWDWCRRSEVGRHLPATVALGCRKGDPVEVRGSSFCPWEAQIQSASQVGPCSGNEAGRKHPSPRNTQEYPAASGFSHISQEMLAPWFSPSTQNPAQCSASLSWAFSAINHSMGTFPILFPLVDWQGMPWRI